MYERESRESYRTAVLNFEQVLLTNCSNSLQTESIKLLVLLVLSNRVIMNLINWSLSPARIQVDALMLQLGFNRESKCREKKRIAKAIA